MNVLRRHLFNIIAFVFLALFVAVWGTVLLRVGFWVPDGRAATARAMPFDPAEVAARLSGRIIAAIVVYLAVGLLVLLLWLGKGTASTDLIGAFALSLLGWLIGAAGVVFQTEKTTA